MIWVIVFLGIALAGLVMCICYAVWLAHKAADVWSEVDMLAVRATEFADLVGPTHGECGPSCWCHNSPEEADVCHAERLAGARP